jgi:hypothetical protein
MLTVIIAEPAEGRDYACADCSERGRPKEVYAMGYYCHDEEKSCYLYMLRMNA